MKLLAGKEAPDAGEITLPEGWHTALLSPEPYVITWTNVRQNVAMASGVGRTPEERYEHAMEYVKLVGLEDYADLSPVELSTGMKQRLGLARVLASQAEVLLMDEPFASLDFLTRAELQHQVLQLQQKLPRTILLVTHQLDEALLLGQSITVMHALGKTETFDLSHLSYPRDLEDPELKASRDAPSPKRAGRIEAAISKKLCARAKKHLQKCVGCAKIHLNFIEGQRVCFLHRRNGVRSPASRSL